MEFPKGATFLPEQFCFEVYDCLYLDNLEIKFAAYMDEESPMSSYNQIAYGTRTTTSRDGANNGITKFLIGHKKLLSVKFYGFELDEKNTEHVVLLEFSDSFKLLIDASLPFTATLYFDNKSVDAFLKDPDIKESHPN